MDGALQSSHKVVTKWVLFFMCICSSIGLTSSEDNMNADDVHEEQRPQKVVTKSKRSAPESSKNSAGYNSSLHNDFVKKSKSSIGLTSPENIMDVDLRKEQSQQKVVAKSTRRSTKRASSEMNKKPKLTLKDQQLNRLVFKEGELPDGCELLYIAHDETLLRGYLMSGRIFCTCCNSLVSASKFEVHAGMPSRKKPYENIFLSNGMSLREYASFLKENGRQMEMKRDDMCRECRLVGGDLRFCDGCPRAYHKECIAETSLLKEKWFCKYCKKGFKCGKPNTNAMSGGVDQQITKSSIRIVYNPDKSELVACALCRSYDFSESGFDDLTVIVCDQCEKEYHIGCLREYKMHDLKELPPNNWFCTPACGRLHLGLTFLVPCGPKKVPDSLMDCIKKNLKDSDEVENITN